AEEAAPSRPARAKTAAKPKAADKSIGRKKTSGAPAAPKGARAAKKSASKKTLGRKKPAPGA
ncbi:transcriptional regulator, partial [Corallococcus exercitus]|nr:transcriptional regulator [Corallococcus exercitus]